MKLVNLIKKEWLQLLILALPFCAAALLWDKLPQRMAVHWNSHGQVNGYAGKAFAALFVPALNVAIVLLLSILPRLDPKCRGYDAETQASVRSVFRTCRLAVSLFMTLITLGILAVALHVSLDITRLIIGGMGGLFIVLGNCMGKLRPNYFAGFRTPWTLESRIVWLKTHRLAGGLMVLGGAVLLIESLLLPSWLCFLAGVLPVILLITLVPTAYSYLLYREETRAARSVH